MNIIKTLIAGLLIYSQALGQTVVPNNKLTLGKTGSADKTLEFNLTKPGASANPKIKWDNATSKLQFSNDGTTYTDFGSGTGGGSSDNKLTNGNFEDGTADWTASGGTFSTTTTAANVFEATTAGTWDASSASQTLTGTAITVGGLAGTNAELTCMIQVSSGTATHTLGVWDGTTLSNTKTITSSTTYTATTINFVVPSSGTVTPRFTSVASDEPLINIDDCYVGKPRNIGTVAQATFIGGLQYVGATNCTWSRTGAGSDTFGDFSADTDCSTPTVSGSATAPSTKLPQIEINNAPPGEYLVIVDGTMGKGGATDNDVQLRLSDGTTAQAQKSYYNGASNGFYAPVNLSGRFNYTTSGNRVFKVQNRTPTTTNSVNLIANSTNANLEIKVYYYPSTSQQAVSSANADYDWTSYTPTFTGFGTATSIDFQHRRVGDSIHIRGKFVSGTPTAVEARVSLPSGLTTADTNKIGTIQQCGTNIYSQTVSTYGAILCEPSVSYFMFGQQSASFGGLTKLTGTNALGSGNTMSLIMSIPISGWSGNQRAPTLVGSVTSSVTTALKMEYVNFDGGSVGSNCTGTCTIRYASNSGITVTRNTTGTYDIGFTSNPFSTLPLCVGNGLRNGFGASVVRQDIANSTTVLARMITENPLNTANDSTNTIYCFGPR